MAEQFIIAFSIHEAKLYGVVGSADQRLGARIRIAAEDSDVGSLLEEAGLEVDAVLQEILARKLKADNAYGYRRLLEAVAGVVGKSLTPEEVLLPGRGWQSLAPAWKLWGQRRLAALWGGRWCNNRELSWPWKRGKQVDWPVALLFPNAQLKQLRTELRTFAGAAVVEKGVPASIDRFNDADYWPREELAQELTGARDTLVQWLNQTIKARRDLLLLHDGQQ